MSEQDWTKSCECGHSLYMHTTLSMPGECVSAGCICDEFRESSVVEEVSPAPTPKYVEYNGTIAGISDRVDLTLDTTTTRDPRDSADKTEAGRAKLSGVQDHADAAQVVGEQKTAEYWKANHDEQVRRKRVQLKILHDAKAQLKGAESNIRELKAALRWIPVEEKLPEKDIKVLVFSPDERGGGIFVDHRRERIRHGYGPLEWDTGDGNRLAITHWMPLPKPPVRLAGGEGSGD